MHSLALANALKDFGAPSATGVDPFVASEGVAPFAGMDFPDAPELPAVEPVDVDALIAEAVAQAETEQAARLAQDHADALQAERERHAQKIAELQTQLAEEASARIQAGIEEMEARLLALTSAVTARILGAVLTDDIRQRSIDRLSGIIREALGDDEAVRIRVRGSLPLYDALKAKLPRYAEQFDFAESAGFDLSVTIDDSVFETRLAEWSAGLAEVLA